MATNHHRETVVCRFGPGCCLGLSFPWCADAKAASLSLQPGEMHAGTVATCESGDRPHKRSPDSRIDTERCYFRNDILMDFENDIPDSAWTRKVAMYIPLFRDEPSKST